MTKKYSTVLFDADNTLFDFDMAEHRALERALTEIGVDFTDETAALYSKINLSYWRAFERGEVTKAVLRTARFKDLFEKIGFEKKIDLSSLADSYLSYLGEGAFLLDGALYLCQRLKEEGYEVDIITNGVTETQKIRLKKSGLDKIVDKVFISEEIGVQKPFPAFFEYVFENIDEKNKERIVVVGDSYGSDIKGACSVGLDCVWLNRLKEENALSLPVTKEIESLGELFEFFGLE